MITIFIITPAAKITSGTGLFQQRESAMLQLRKVALMLAALDVNVNLIQIVEATIIIKYV